MLFNSLSFLLFFPIVVTLYWLLPTQKTRTCFLAIASLYFYMCWKPVFVLLLLSCVLVNYLAGIWLAKSGYRYRKWIMTMAIIFQVGILFFYKYYNFVAESIAIFLQSAGLLIQINHLDILLPLGISFFTFKGISYIVDVYNGKVEAEQNPIMFTTYLCFFPQLIAGPIDRATNLLPQLKQQQSFDARFLTSGAKMMLWGYFMKIVFANRAAIYVDTIYSHLEQQNGTSILLAAILYSMQIYCDFAGYSLISIGCARAMGISVPDNFVRPYTAISISDFWHRWHISLTRWFTDYIYIPLGGSRCSRWRNYGNIIVVFLLSGLWHGAAWNFVIWGAIHGLLQIAEKTLGIARRTCNSVWERIIRTTVTFLLVTIAWIFFRMPSFMDAITAIGRIFTNPGKPYMEGDATSALEYCVFTLALIIIHDLLEEFFPGRFSLMNHRNSIVRFIAYILLTLLILTCGVFDASQFIYAQF